MEFDVTRAVLAGLVGTVAMTLVMSLGAAMMGMKMDMPMTLGTMLLPKGPASWAVGLMMHLVMGAGFFIIYALLIDALGIRSAIVGWTALFGVIHALAAGMAFGMMPALHPRMAAEGETGGETVPAPGLFATKMGTVGPMALVMAHVVYGAAGGAIYAA